MDFIIDKQTLNDLTVFESRHEDRSLIELFKPISLKGKEKLREFFNQPSTSAILIQGRLTAIEYIEKHGLPLEISKGDLDFIEHYLSRGNKPTSISNYRAWEKGVWDRIKPSNAYYIVRRGVSETVSLLNSIHHIIKTQAETLLPPLLIAFNQTLLSILEDPDFSLVLKLNHKKKLSTLNVHYCDYLFRYLGYKRIQEVLDIVYQLDVFQAVAWTAKERQFCYPHMTSSTTAAIQFKGLFHPFLNRPVKNEVSFNQQKNVCFLTGSNMAGKSTFLKAIGVAVYLAHLGFPVPAAAMEASIMNGLVTTINLSDTLHNGHSHFYSEVNRVKEVALTVKRTPRIMVIFDELFRGTNVKDAFDASKAIIDAFTTVTESFFIVSTHIVEVAHELKTNHAIDFKYMETIFNDEEPSFSYQLKDGITDERIGMWIIKKEKILDIIQQDPWYLGAFDNKQKSRLDWES